MAVIESTISNGNDLKEINDTLYAISENIKYYFTALSIEDNFSPDAFLKYQEANNQIAAVQIANRNLITDYANLSTDTSSRIALMENGISLSVTKGDLTNQLNLEPDAIVINGNRLIVSGSNFSLNENNDVTVSGEITAISGKIAGWEIKNGMMDGGSTARITCNVFNNYNDIYLHKIEVIDTPGDTDMRYCSVSGGGATFHVDEGTVFLNGFDGLNLIVENKIHCGIIRSSYGIDVNSQIVADRCYTRKTGTTWSDERLKDNIKEISEEDEQHMLQDIRPCRYTLKSNGSRSSGFIAQELEQIESGLHADCGIVGKAGDTLTVNYDSLIPFLIKTIQRQTEEIDALSNR